MFEYIIKKVETIGAVILLCLYMPLFLYLNNIGEAHFSECLEPMCIFLLIGLATVLLFFLITKELVKSCISSLLFCFLFFNYSIIEMGIQILNPSLRYWHIFPCLILSICFSIYIIFKKCSTHTLETIPYVAFVVLVGLLLVNVLTVSPQIIANLSSSNKISKSSFVEIKSATGVERDRPNIYYFIFDEYSAFDVLQRYFDYDNSAFGDFLENHYFAVSYDSQNDSQQTYTVVANYINLDYIAFDTDTLNERGALLKSRVIFDLAESGGYEINPVIGGDFFGLGSKLKSSSSTIEGVEFSALIYKNTAYYPFIKNNVYNEAVAFDKAFDTFQNAQFYKDYPDATFHMSYFKLPHQPFIFDKNGGEVPYAHINDWTNKTYYLEQLMYTTKCIKETVENIISNDPDAIIILQSDHSVRNLQTESGEYIIEKYDRRHILNAVYFGGADISEIKSKSGVNTLRIVLSRLFGLDLPQLEVPISDKERPEED